MKDEILRSKKKAELLDVERNQARSKYDVKCAESETQFRTLESIISRLEESVKVNSIENSKCMIQFTFIWQIGSDYTIKDTKNENSRFERRYWGIS